jgi:hypothetical protein
MRGIRTLTIFAATFASVTAMAAEGDRSREAFYRCKDGKGQTLYGDSMPFGCNGYDTEVLNAHGMVLRTIEGDQTRASRQSREAAEKNLLAAQYRATEQTIKNLRERQSRLETQVARFKPYSDKAGAGPVPDHLAEEMVNTVNGMRVYQESLTKNRAEQADVKSSFGADIKRFKELKGIR